MEILMYAISFMIAFGACIVGAITGMGGGVIIKPLFDILGQFDPQTIGTMSAITVFSMALVSASKAVMNKAPIDFKVAVVVAIGSIIGGTIGQEMLNMVTASIDKNIVVIVQNICLAIMLLCVFLYMLNKTKIKSFQIKNSFVVFLVGLFLGITSSFLGIGGGPINVVVFIFLFSYNTKMAAVTSIVTIVFAQISKLVSVAIDGSLFEVVSINYITIILMVVGAISGGLLGAKISSKVDDKKVDIYFNAVQIFVLCICVINVIRNI